MPARLTEWIDAAVRLGPAVPVAIVFAIALIEAAVLPRRLWAKGAWIVAVVACGVLASADLRLEQLRSHTATLTASQAVTDDEIAALRGLWGQWDAVSRTLPPAGETPAASFDTAEDAFLALSFQVTQIHQQIAALRQQSKGRSIDDETATKLADYLRQFGSFPVVVSCVPEDVEAYAYANQLGNILRAAGWDAHGPEISAARPGAAQGTARWVHPLQYSLSQRYCRERGYSRQRDGRAVRREKALKKEVPCRPAAFISVSTKPAISANARCAGSGTIPRRRGSLPTM